VTTITEKFTNHLLPDLGRSLRSACLICLLMMLPIIVVAQEAAAVQGVESNNIEIQDMPEAEVIAFSKTVIVRKHAKAVFVFGGDVIVEGRVETDVGVIGGNIIQKEGGYIGGDVIVVGGSYRPESATPLRAEAKETVVFGIFEDELKRLGQDPVELLSPSFTPAYFAQRVLAVLFWFLITLGFSTIAPGAVSRAIARTKLSSLKVAGFGLGGLIAAVAAVIAAAGTLPEYLSVVIWVMTFLLLILAYVFGRVTLQILVGKSIQKYLFSDRKHPESLAILYGVIVWTLLLSLPFVWTFVLLTLFAAGIGLVLTARSGDGWRTA
jgi:Ca2+/Na+ antiporter